MQFLHDSWTLLKLAAFKWVDDKVPRLGAALAFYSVLSLVPLLILVLGGAGFVFGTEAAEDRVVAQIDALVGGDVARAAQSILTAASRTGEAAINLGLVVLILGASGAFGELQDSMNTIWHVQPKTGKAWLRILKERFLAFTMVIISGFLLLVSMVFSAMLALLGQYAIGLSASFETVMPLIDFAASFAVVTLIFAMIFKIVPETRVAWGDVWGGAILTAVFFILGKYGIALYLSQSGIALRYGAAGSIIILLVWVYYSAQILFFGAELTHVYAIRHGSRRTTREGRIRRWRKRFLRSAL